MSLNSTLTKSTLNNKAIVLMMPCFLKLVGAMKTEEPSFEVNNQSAFDDFNVGELAALPGIPIRVGSSTGSQGRTRSSTSQGNSSNNRRSWDPTDLSALSETTQHEPYVPLLGPPEHIRQASSRYNGVRGDQDTLSIRPEIDSNLMKKRKDLQREKTRLAEMERERAQLLEEIEREEKRIQNDKKEWEDIEQARLDARQTEIDRRKKKLRAKKIENIRRIIQQKNVDFTKHFEAMKCDEKRREFLRGFRCETWAEFKQLLLVAESPKSA